MTMHRKYRKEAPVTEGGSATYIGAMAANTANINAKANRSVGSTWYEAMAEAWGNALDKQANVITDLSNQVNNAGSDTPSTMVQLTAESQKMGFLANNASTSNNSVGEALSTLAKKQ